ncbi:MAG TPA: cytochrome bc complex cytochrome b subunit [Thermoanaerobaculia bacterium]|nr:cytochrome bc complex cytochrome b subunit [Thermoanaerobaculia bacterium]
MSAPEENAAGAAGGRRAAGGAKQRLATWFNERMGWQQMMRQALDEPVPGGARWAYVLGSGLLFVFINQVVTGIFLSLYYVPSADHAHTTVAYIQKQVAAGSFLRSLHSYGSSVMVVLLMLHLGQTYVYGAYKNRRELLWMMGCFLLLLVMGMSFTGYLLPWDQKAYFATAVGTNMASEIPLAGGWLKLLLRGGNEMGTLTLSRFFMLHVFLIPGLIFAAVGAHVFLFRKAGAAGPPRPQSELRTLRRETFFPSQVFKDFVFGIGLIVMLGALAHARPVSLGPAANPADATYLPRPEWYYLPFFQWVKYWHGPFAAVGVVLIPALLVAALFAVPFLDRSPERRPLRRPGAMAGLLLVAASLVFLGLQSGSEDRRDPALRAKLAAQEEAERQFAAAPFEPEESLGVRGGATSTAPAALSAEAAKGSLLFESESCSGCHGAAGHGGGGLVQIGDLGSRYTTVQLAAILRSPRPDMLAGGMQPVELKKEDLEALVAFLLAPARTAPGAGH